jgi:phosphatidylinositol-3-phosphatase
MRPWRSGLGLVCLCVLLSGLLGCQSSANDVTPSAAASATVGTSGPAGQSAAPSPTTAGLGSEPPGPPTSQPTSSASSVAGRHVWWLILENKEYGSIIGNSHAPYLSSLADHYGLATNYFAIGHPSEPNYIALVAGSTLGVTTDGTYNLDAPSLFSQLRAGDVSWRVYAQDVPAGCFRGSQASGGQDGPGAPGTYVRKHNPAISFTSISGSTAECGSIQPLGAFSPSAGAFEMIIPNLINDMHDGTIAQGDAFVRAFVPEILSSAAFTSGGVLYITFDEGSSSAGSLGDRGGRIATLIIAADVSAGFRDGTYLDHWSLLRATESLLGLPCLANACQRAPIGH